jgi:hypothetical protein
LPNSALPMHWQPKYWRGFLPPTSSQIIGVKLYWIHLAKSLA